jgi:hypothetical protein
MLRKAAGDGIVVEEDGVLALGEGVGTDLEALGHALAAGAVDAAWARWNGGPLQNLAIPDSPAFQGWVDQVRSRWELRLGDALLARAEAETDPGARLPWLERALQVRPHSVVLHRARIRTLLEQRDVDGAETALARARAVVDEATPGTFDEVAERVRALRRTRYAGHDDPDRLVPDFVGRAEEFSRLAALWRGALSGRPRAAALVGPMGIGKTRLAGEFLALARSDGAHVAAVKAAEAERTLELGVAVTLARDLLRLPGGAGISAASARTLQHLVPSSGNGVAPAGPAPASGALADAMEDLIEAVAHEVPLVLFVDDVQWVDPASRALLLRLARTLRTARTLVLFTSRTEEGDAGALRALRAMEDQDRGAVVVLAPLTEAEVAEMIGLLLTDREPAAADRLVDQIVRISGGTPLMAVEVLRVLADRALLEHGPDGWSLARGVELDEIELPDTIHDLVANRLAALDPPAVTVLSALARAHHPVPVDRLPARTGLDPDAVRAGIDQLLHRGLVSSPPGRDELALAHDSLRAPVEGWTEEHRPPRPGAPPGREPPAQAPPPGGSQGRALVLLALVALVGVTLVGRRPAEGGTPASPNAPAGVIHVTLSQRDAMLLRWRPDGTVSRQTLRAPDPIQAVPGAVRIEGAGDTVWLGTVGSHQSGPDLVEVRSGHPPVTLLDGEGDQNIGAHEWSRRWVLSSAQEAAAGRFRKDLVLLDRVRGERRFLLRPGYAPHGAQISRDGRRILVVAETLEGPDSIVELSPAGRLLAATPVPRNLYLMAAWCGDVYLAIRVEPGRTTDAVLLTPGRGDPLPLELPEPVNGSTVRCSPDGRHLAALDRRGSTLLVMRRPTLEVVARHPLPTEALGLAWTADTHRRLPARLVVGDTLRTLAWGGRGHLEARALLEDGRVDTAGVTFRSLDPQILRVQDDSVVGIRPGDGRVEVSARDWLLDTMRISVIGTVGGDALLTDPMEDLDPEVWPHRLGDGFARPATVDGERVLELGSDPLARWVDGWVSRELEPSPEGLTVELDVQLDLTRNDKQSFELAVIDADPPADPDDADWYPSWNVRNEVRVRHPGLELGDFEAEMASVVVDQAHIRRLPLPGFPKEPGAWTRLVVQIAPDGLVSLLVDGRPVPMQRLTTELLGSRPRILLRVRAVDTRLYVRDLAVWPQLRYGGEALPSER